MATQTLTLPATLADALAEFSAGDNCPKHDSQHKKCYTFGSSMSAETEVCVFHGCRCAVSVWHDPVGTYPSVAKIHASYNEAAGTGKLRAADAAAKYR